jgi:hypothetical protein
MKIAVEKSKNFEIHLHLPANRGMISIAMQVSHAELGGSSSGPQENPA